MRFVYIMTRLPHEIQNHILRFVPNHYQSMKQGLIEWTSAIHGLHPTQIQIHNEPIDDERHEALWRAPDERNKEIGLLQFSIANDNRFIYIGSKKNLNIQRKKWNKETKIFRRDNGYDDDDVYWGQRSLNEYLTFSFACPYYNKRYYCHGLLPNEVMVYLASIGHRDMIQNLL